MQDTLEIKFQHGERHYIVTRKRLLLGLLDYPLNPELGTQEYFLLPDGSVLNVQTDDDGVVCHVTHHDNTFAEQISDQIDYDYEKMSMEKIELIVDERIGRGEDERFNEVVRSNLCKTRTLADGAKNFCREYRQQSFSDSEKRANRKGAITMLEVVDNLWRAHTFTNEFHSNPIIRAIKKRIGK